MKRLIKNILIFMMWHPLRLVVRILPLRLIYSMGSFGGKILAAISRDKKALMADELSKVLKDKSSGELHKLTTACFSNYVVSELEVLLYPMLNRKMIDKIVEIEGMEHLDAALKKGKGVLLYQAHFGAFQMVMPVIGYMGYKMNQLSALATEWKDSVDSKIQQKGFDIKADYENKLPVKHIPVSGTLRPVYRALAKNEIVGITIDGGGGNKVTEIEFLGRRAKFQQGSADLAVRTGAEIVPAFITTQPGLKHKLTIHPALDKGESLSEEKRIPHILQGFADILESYVFLYPAHYGYTLCLRRIRSKTDRFPMFDDYVPI